MFELNGTTLSIFIMTVVFMYPVLLGIRSMMVKITQVAEKKIDNWANDGE